MKKIITSNAKSTRKKAGQMGRSLKPGTWLGLSGDLGSGKTTFVQGIAEGLGVKDIVQSPTFVIIREYQGRIKLIHIDLYRLNFEEIESLGLEDYNMSDAVVAVEWAEKLPEVLKTGMTKVRFKLKSINKREITIS